MSACDLLERAGGFPETAGRDSRVACILWSGGPGFCRSQGKTVVRGALGPEVSSGRIYMFLVVQVHSFLFLMSQ